MDSPLGLANVQAYTVAVAALKGLEAQEQALAAQAIEKALTRVYRAVAVDIDGTLTPANDATLNAEVAGILKTVLRRGVPVILVTGRGDQSAAEAMDALQSRRRDESPGRLHCLMRNGAAVLEPAVDVASGNPYVERLIGDPLDPSIADLVGAIENKPDSVVTPTVDSGSPGYIRLQYRDPQIRDSAFEELIGVFPPGTIINVSHYQDIYTVNITRITKNQALTILAGELGLEPDEVLRIGDQGQAGGNDADLLDTIVGFSVDLVSSSPDKCHPVVDDNGEVIKGTKATTALLNGVVLSPPIKRIHASLDSRVIRNFGTIERRSRIGAEQIIGDIEENLAASLAALVGDGGGLSGPSRTRISDIYDPLSGAVRLRDYETDELRDQLGADHPAEQLFCLAGVFDVPPKSPFVMASDSGVLLRGRYYYMGFTSRPSSGRPGEFLEFSANFAAQSVKAVNALSSGEPSLTRLKLVLGIADQIRGALLQIVHLAWVRGKEAEDYVLLKPTVELAVDHIHSHVRLLLQNDRRWKDALSDYANDLAVIQDTLTGLASSDLASLDELSFKKPIIREREADNFLINVAAVTLALERHRSRMDLRRHAHVACYGLPYGGIELPLLAKVIGHQLDLDIIPGYLHASTYEDAELGESLRSKKTHSVQELEGPFPRWILSEEPADATLIADDNLTTAVTLQLAIDVLSYHNIEADGVIVVQYPSLNRREHMRLPGHGCVDPDALLGFVRGLVQPTPYTRLLTPGEGGDLYRDKFKVFNKSKRRIEALLEKAGLLLDDEQTDIEKEVGPIIGSDIS